MTARMPDATDFWIRPALRWARQEGRWDLIVSSAGPYATHLIGAQCKKEGLTDFWVADYRDLWTDSHSFRGMFPFTRVEKKLEQWAMGYADLITTVSQPLAETLASKYGNDKVEVVENGFDSSDLAELPPASIFPCDAKVRIVYTGSIYEGRQDPSPLFGAISQLADDKGTIDLLDRLEVIFYGAKTEGLAERVTQHNVERWVRVVDRVPRFDALRAQRDAHALLFLEWDQGGVDGIISGKLFEYMSSRTPIWGIGVTEKTTTGKLIRETKTGTLFGVDVSLISKKLRRLLVSGKKEPVWAVDELVSRFERGVLAKRLLKLVTQRMFIANPIDDMQKA